MTKKQLAILILIIISSLGIRLLLSPGGGHTYDMDCWKKWSSSIVRYGFTNIYHKTNSNYPPLFLYALGFIGHFYQKFISPTFEMDKAILNILLKTPAIITDILTGIVIFLATKKFLNLKLAYLSMLFYIFNPAIIYESAWWGQVDALNTFFILLSFLFLTIPKKQLYSWIALALACMVKFQSIIFLPLFLLLAWKKNRYKLKPILKGIAIVLLGTLIILSPFLFTSKLDSFLKSILQGTVGLYPVVSMWAFNIWWPAQLIKSQLIDDTHLIFGLISYKTLGLGLFALAYLFTLYFVYKKEDFKSMWLATSFVALAFFMLPTQMHERYLFPIFALLSMIWICDKKLWLIYTVLSVTFFLNLIYVLPLPFMPKALNLELGAASPVICLINLGVFIYFIKLMIQRLKKPKYVSEHYYPSL